MRGCPHHFNKRLSSDAALEASKLVSGNDNNFIAPVHRDMLRSFAVDLSNQLTKARLGILQ
jgi:hypothetical protein